MTGKKIRAQQSDILAAQIIDASAGSRMVGIPRIKIIRRNTVKIAQLCDFPYVVDVFLLILAHDILRYTISLRVLISFEISIGFAMCPFIPAARALAISSAKVFAVMA